MQQQDLRMKLSPHRRRDKLKGLKLRAEFEKNKNKLSILNL